MCHIANGNLGHVEIEPDELKNIRWQEAERAARIIGAKHYSIDINDLFVSAQNNDLTCKLSRVVRDVQPDLIMTHYPNDYMMDHVQTCEAVARASFAASCPHFDPEDPNVAVKVSPIYHMDTLSGIGFIPTEYVDISDVIETKLEALACHESQIIWMQEHDGIDFLDKTRICSMARGYQCGVQYAEGFRPCTLYLRMSAKRLLP